MLAEITGEAGALFGAGGLVAILLGAATQALRKIASAAVAYTKHTEASLEHMRAETGHWSRAEVLLSRLSDDVAGLRAKAHAEDDGNSRIEAHG